MKIHHRSMAIRLTALAAGLLLASAAVAGPALAKVYRYKKNGVWHFTDDPARVPIQLRNEATTAPAGNQVPGSPVSVPVLLVDFPAANPIEEATRATVAVEGTAGYGSGFFITAQGHIITNRHVVRPVAEATAKQEKYFAQTESKIAEITSQLKQEEQRLQKAAQNIERLKNIAVVESDPNLKRAYQDRYTNDLAILKRWQKNYQQRKQLFEKQKAKFEEQHRQYNYRKSVAGLSRTFTIYLADRSKFYVRLEALSNNHDLALLKLDGYQTPYLKAGSGNSLAQGDPVYAIGNPAKLHNSVTSGVFSGYEEGFLKTNAQIYPGNSGGPLVNASGQILGINTFKKITRKFEGLGFAIPFDAVWHDFGDWLPPRN